MTLTGLSRSNSIRDQRIVRLVELASPRALTQELPLSDEHAEVLLRGRAEVEAILQGHDDRLLVVVGPCSVHDVAATQEYAERLAAEVKGRREDLCLAMRAESILIERMAGKSTVGIQVPNREREIIWLRENIESQEFLGSKSKLTIAMGKDINGRIAAADLASMPHLLIAGSTGTGKSVAVNSMIMSILYKATPAEVRLVLVDPKRLELGNYEGVPHLYTPIITEPKLAANALRNAVREMERRLKLLAAKGVRNIDQYNRLFDHGDTPSLFAEDTDEKPIPYIVIIIDELADLIRPVIQSGQVAKN